MLKSPLLQACVETAVNLTVSFENELVPLNDRIQVNYLRKYKYALTLLRGQEEWHLACTVTTILRSSPVTQNLRSSRLCKNITQLTDLGNDISRFTEIITSANVGPGKKVLYQSYTNIVAPTHHQSNCNSTNK